MKKIAVLLISLSFAVYADNLEIDNAQVACIDKKEGINKDSFKYRYGIELQVENSSQKPIILVTKINSVLKLHDDKSYRITLTYQEETRGDDVLIPPVSKLELIELLPGDKALISHQFSDKNLIEKASFEFYSKPIYGGRFNSWVGRLNTQEITPHILYKCKT